MVATLCRYKFQQQLFFVGVLAYAHILLQEGVHKSGHPLLTHPFWMEFTQNSLLQGSKVRLHPLAHAMFTNELRAETKGHCSEEPIASSAAEQGSGLRLVQEGIINTP